MSENIAGIVLAAGASSRLGRPKQRIELGGETLLARAVRVAGEVCLSPVIAIVIESSLIKGLQEAGAEVLLNRKAYEGISSSIVAGVRWAQALQVKGVVLMTCDQVALTPHHLRALCDQPESAAGSAYAGKTGIPAYFPSSEFPALLALRGDKGAQQLLVGARTVVCEALALDIDTEEDLARAQALFREGKF